MAMEVWVPENELNPLTVGIFNIANGQGEGVGSCPQCDIKLTVNGALINGTYLGHVEFVNIP